MSVDEETGSMYTFKNNIITNKIDLYTRGSSQTSFDIKSVDYTSADIRMAHHGKIIHDKHMAMIVSKNDTANLANPNNLFFMIQKYVSGSPPDKFVKDAISIDEDLQNSTEAVYDFDIDWAYISTQKIIIACTARRLFAREYEITTNGFFAKT